MPIDLRSESPPVPLSDIPDLPCIPRRRRGRKLHKSTAFRWANPGVRGIRLEVLRIGGTLCTTVPALQRFFERLTRPLATSDGPRADVPPERIIRVEQELDRKGL